jgi:micrococcal nuclease
MSEIIRFQKRKNGMSVAAFSATVAVCGLATFGILILVGSQRSVSSQSAALVSNSPSLPICSGPVRKNCVVDGDTFWLDGVKIRIADIDTPEIGKPQCEDELALGKRATQRLRELLNAGPFELQAWPERDEDQYGRKLRVVVREGRSIGDKLVSEGLARTWTGRREPWC